MSSLTLFNGFSKAAKVFDEGHKRILMKTGKAFLKSFQAPQISVKIKSYVNFILIKLSERLGVLIVKCSIVSHAQEAAIQK